MNAIDYESAELCKFTTINWRWIYYISIHWYASFKERKRKQTKLKSDSFLKTFHKDNNHYFQQWFENWNLSIQVNEENVLSFSNICKAFLNFNCHFLWLKIEMEFLVLIFISWCTSKKIKRILLWLSTPISII